MNVTVRARIGLTLDGGRRVHTGEVVELPESDAVELIRTGRADLAIDLTTPPPRCSARRDELWKAGLK